MANKLIALVIFFAAVTLACVFRYDYNTMVGTRVDRWTGNTEIKCIIKKDVPWQTTGDCFRNE